ncbi:hypothetical protein Tco_1174349 [Tanacetum coccineum]
MRPILGGVKIGIKSKVLENQSTQSLCHHVDHVFPAVVQPLPAVVINYCRELTGYIPESEPEKIQRMRRILRRNPANYPADIGMLMMWRMTGGGAP